MSQTKPVVYILRGDDREAVESHIRYFYGSLGEPDLADLNTTRLEGKSASLNDLRGAALALPLLTERRMVVLEDALRMVDGDDSGAIQAEFLALLDILPPSTALVLVVEDTQKKRKVGGTWETPWETLKDKHWLVQWAQNAGERARIEDCLLPSAGEMIGWIRKKAVGLGGAFTNGAATVLADFVGNNTQQAVQEITKLLTYVNYARPVEDEDVTLLTVREYERDIFDMVDAIGTRRGEEAIKLLHRILEENDLIPVFSMIVRQFRLILQAREIMDGGGNDREVAKALGIHGFVARKAFSQARHFSLSELEAIYQLLHQIDVGIKTGGMEGEIALDIFITRVAMRMV